MLVVTVVATIVVGGLYSLNVQQRRFSLWGQRVVSSHDAFRVARSVLAAELREAVVPDGDVLLPSSDSLVVRSPVGFGVVCAVRDNPDVLGLNRTVGRMPQAGDSLLVYGALGWTVMSPRATEAPGQRGMTCPHGSKLPTHQYRFDNGDVGGIPVGAPVRTFQRLSYHLLVDASGGWLARTDAYGTSKLVGPLAPSGLNFAFLDAYGLPTARSEDAVAVQLSLVMPLVASTQPGRASLDTLTAVLGGRNR